MIIEELIPILSFWGLGLIFLKILSSLKIKLTFAEKIIYSISAISALLIIPWSIFGLQKWTIAFQLWPIILALIGLITLGAIIYKNFRQIITWLENPKQLLQSIADRFNSIDNTEKIIVLIITTLMICYTIFNLVLAFRDFDAIWMYIPDAMWYYRINYIPQLNPLNFRLSTKEPFVSLLFAYALYITGSLNIKLLPILFIIGWFLTVYVFIHKIWHNATKALMGVLLFLLSPFVYYIFNFWVYYQEIYVSFFYAVTLLALFSYLRIDDGLDEIAKKRIEIFYLCMGSLAFALTLLAKLSGWSLIFIIILIYPLSTKGKIVQTILLVGITVFLFFKVSITYYIGIGIFLILYGLLMLVILWKSGSNETERTSKNWLGLVMIPFGLLFGGFWLYDTFKTFHQYSSVITDLYLIIPNQAIKDNFKGTPFNSARFLLESAHSTDFVSLVFYLLVGNMFVLFWILPKLRVIFDDQVKFFVLWVIGFFVLWVTYQGFASIRYLSVILVPIIVIVTHGFYKLYEDLTGKKDWIPLSVVLLACLLSLASYYYPISLTIFSNQVNTKTINEQFLLSAYHYYHNGLYYIIFALIVSILFLLSYSKLNTLKMPMLINWKPNPRFVKGFVIIIILFIPFLVPSVVFISSTGNIDQFNSTFVYYQRPAYQEVVNALLNENNPSSGIIVVNFPGLPIYLNQPTLDLFAEREGIRTIYTKNVSELLQMLLQPLVYLKNNYNINIPPNVLSSSFSFDYIVIPNYANNYYPFYAQTLFNQSFLFSLLFQKSLFKILYENSEFLVFKRMYTVPMFSGIVTSSLQSGFQDDSIFGRIQFATSFSQDLRLGMDLSLPEALGSQLTINTTVQISQLDSSVTLNSTSIQTVSSNNSLVTISVPLNINVLKPESFSITQINLNILINKTSSLSLRNYSLSSSTDGLLLSYNSVTNNWSISTGLGLLTN